MTAELLLIAGSDENERAASGEEAITGLGNTDVHQLIDRHEPYDRLHVTRQYFRKSDPIDLFPYRCLLNLITDPDQNPKVLDTLRRILKNYRGTVINRPEAVLRSTREQVARLLAPVPGLIVPNAARFTLFKPDQAVETIARTRLAYPLIIRLAGSHGGEIVGCFDGPAQAAQAPFDRGRYVATQFVDFRSADGLYRKYRVFFFGSQIVFRHMLVSDHWNIHARDRMRFMVHRPDLLAEEARLFETGDLPFDPALVETLREVGERMPLDYFGMDFGIAPDGRAVLFEANATMNFFPFAADPRFDYLKRCLDPAQRAFDAMVGAAPRSLRVPSLAEMLTR